VASSTFPALAIQPGAGGIGGRSAGARRYPRHDYLKPPIAPTVVFLLPCITNEEGHHSGAYLRNSEVEKL